MCSKMRFHQLLGRKGGGIDPPLQNLVKSLNSVFNSRVMILRVNLFERAFNSEQFKKMFELIQ